MSELDLGRVPEREYQESPSKSAQQPSMPRLDRAGMARPVSQIAEAITEFEGRPLNAAESTLMKNAMILIEAREHRLAINILRNLLMRAPEHVEALRQMGLCHREEGRFDEALKFFKAMAKCSRSIEAQILFAETLYLAERDEMSLGAYREVLKHVIDDQAKLFEVYKNVGNIHVRAGDYEAAEEYYNKAYVIDPKSDVLMVNYGTLEIQRESFGDAVERFRAAVAINPNNDKAWVGLALVHRQMGDLELAWANVQRAVDINGRNRTALRLIVEWAVQDYRFSPAIEGLQDYLAKDCEDAEMSFTLAKILTHVGRLREARLEMERVLALDPAMEGAEQLARVLDREIMKAHAVGSEPAA